jgi:hypothetical protein
VNPLADCPGAPCPGVLWVASAYYNGSEGIQPTADRSATSISITVEIFGLLVHLISFIPVIRQITRFADPPIS